MGQARSNPGAAVVAGGAGEGSAGSADPLEMCLHDFRSGRLFPERGPSSKDST